MKRVMNIYEVRSKKRHLKNSRDVALTRFRAESWDSAEEEGKTFDRLFGVGSWEVVRLDEDGVVVRRCSICKAETAFADTCGLSECQEESYKRTMTAAFPRRKRWTKT